MPGFSPKAIVIDGRGHMLGRLASIVAKLLLSGNKVSIALFFLLHVFFVPVNVSEPEPGAEIKLPPGAGAEITNFGSDTFLFITDLLEKKNHGC
jgi:hypothetical protein